MNTISESQSKKWGALNLSVNSLKNKTFSKSINLYQLAKALVVEKQLKQFFPKLKFIDLIAEEEMFMGLGIFSSWKGK